MNTIFASNRCIQFLWKGGLAIEAKPREKAVRRAVRLARHPAPSHRHGRRYDVVFEALRRAIIRGVLPIGNHLVASAAARQMGVSRTPVREALSRLEGVGLVHRTGRTYAVIGVGPAEVDQICFVRAILEASGAALAAEHVTHAEIDHLETLVHSMSKGIRAHEGETYRVLHRQFHRQIMVSARNMYLTQTLEPLMDLVDVLWEAASPDAARYERAQREHAGLLEALKRKEPALARQLMDAHVGWGMSLIRASLERKEAARVDLRALVETVAAESDDRNSQS